MKMAFVTPFLLVLILFCLSCSPRHLVSVQQPPAGMKHVDISPYGSDTVDVGEVVRNLHNRKMYRELWEILLFAKNASLSSSTVNLLKFVLAEHSRNSVLNDDSEDMRVRAVALLGLSRHPEAIPIVTDFMFRDPAWRVRAAAACALGRLAGEKALPPLLAALEKRKIGKLNGGFLIAGEKAVPHIIRWLEKDFAKNGGQRYAQTHVRHLWWIGDRRAIDPLLRIIAHPASPSDPTVDRVRSEAATTLGHFASELWYNYLPDSTSEFLAVDPVTRRESRKVNSADRKRIIKALQNADYDPDGLVPFSLSPPDDKGN